MTVHDVITFLSSSWGSHEKPFPMATRPQESKVQTLTGDGVCVCVRLSVSQPFFLCVCLCGSHSPTDNMLWRFWPTALQSYDKEIEFSSFLHRLEGGVWVDMLWKCKIIVCSAPSGHTNTQRWAQHDIPCWTLFLSSANTGSVGTWKCCRDCFASSFWSCRPDSRLFGTACAADFSALPG